MAGLVLMPSSRPAYWSRVKRYTQWRMSPTLRSGVIVPNVLSYFFGGGLRGLEKIPMRVGHLIGIGGVKIEHRKNLSSGEPFEIGGLDNSDVCTPMFCDGARWEERSEGKGCVSTCR